MLTCNVSMCLGLTLLNRIYKPKYMDEDSKTSPKKAVDAPLSSVGKDTKDKDAKPAGRSRARSIWGRSKKEKPAAS